jgi:hypothetical protein
MVYPTSSAGVFGGGPLCKKLMDFPADKEADRLAEDFELRQTRCG